MAVNKFNFPWCPETMPVDNRTRMVDKSYMRLTLYNTFFVFFCLLQLLFVVCVMHFVITSSLYCCMCDILHKNFFHFDKRSAYF